MGIEFAMDWTFSPQIKKTSALLFHPESVAVDKQTTIELPNLGG